MLICSEGIVHTLMPVENMLLIMLPWVVED